MGRARAWCRIIAFILGVSPLLAQALAATNAPPASQPAAATRPAAAIRTPHLSVAERLAAIAPAVQDAIDQGMAKLSAGECQDALPIFLEANALYDKPPRPLDDNHILINHAIAYCYLRLTEYPKARPFMDMAVAGHKTNRSMTINAAKLDIQSKQYVMRAVGALDRFVARHPDDEVALNLLGVALDTALANPLFKPRLSHLVENLTVYNTRLEATRPDQHRWGAKWLSEREYTSLRYRLSDAQRSITSAQSSLDSAATSLDFAKRDLATAQREYEDSRRRAIFYGHPVPSAYSYRLDYYEDRVNHAQERVDHARATLAEAEKTLPQPVWVDVSEPVMPQRDLVSTDAP